MSASVGFFVRVAWFVGLPALVVVVACGKVQADGGVLPAASNHLENSTALPSRAQVVQRADELAVLGSKQAGQEGAKAILRAAELRERIWRLEGREADALEAAELYRAAAEKAGNDGCEAKIQLALLKGELMHDPVAAYKGVYLASASKANKPCRQRSERLLASLSAFAPSAAELATLDPGPAASSPAPAGADQRQGPVVVPNVSESDRSPARITGVKPYGGKDAARVVVFVTRPTLFEVGSLPASSGRGPRLFIDIDGASYEGASVVDSDGLVQRVRLGKRRRGTRVVLDLTESAYRKIFYVPEPFRLIIDVSKEPPPAVDLNREGPRDVRRVVLDPGHGGHDPGAVGPAGLREKDVALDIAHRAAPLIARELNISTLLTRDADVFVQLDERVARANAFGADLFVSIHCNASENDKSRGVTTFVLDASRDALASRVAARENSASPAAAAELANVMSRVLDAASAQRSQHFAELLQRAALTSVIPRYDRVSDLGVRSAGFYVLAGAQMPAVLFEVSFISNPTEEVRLDSGDYRQKLADSIVNAVRAYRDGV